jgi:hypothetical protein
VRYYTIFEETVTVEVPFSHPFRGAIEKREALGHLNAGKRSTTSVDEAEARNSIFHMCSAFRGAGGRIR